MGTLNSSRSRQGLSFGEAVVAIFLILAGVIVTITLFHSGMRYSNSSQRRAMAAVFGRKVMMQVRAWARQPANFDSTWATYSGVDITDPDFPGMTAHVECDRNGRELFDPSSEFESDLGPIANRMQRSMIPVRVSVDWGMTGREVRLVSLVGAPERRVPATLVINRDSGPSDPVPSMGIVGFSAELRDAGGRPIPDITFSWSVLPISGNATLLKGAAPRNGQTMQLQHVYTWNPLMTPPQSGPISGQVEIEVVCRYRGRRYVHAVPVALQ